MSAPEIEIFADGDALATEVAMRFLALVGQQVRDGRWTGVYEIVLTGGTIADKIHREIARLARKSDAPTEPQVRFWWGDERFVAARSTDRNAAQAHAAMIAPLEGIWSDNSEEVPALGTVTNVQVAAEVYADLLRYEGPDPHPERTHVFDLVMLGIGPDGHVASLFPGHPALDVTDTTTVAVTDSPKPPPERVTMTFPTLNSSREVWFLASGEGKAEAVARALAPEGSIHETPARGVQGRDRTIWFLDQPAASQLPPR